MVIIALATIAAFLPALGNGFVDWDDNINIVANPHYRGLGGEQIAWMFTTRLLGHWIPVTWLTFGLDYVVWGMKPFGYHLTNLLFHTGNAVLVYALASRLLARGAPAASETARGIGAAAAALLFALHPSRAESVAWVTERRDVVSGWFWLLVVLAYLTMVDATPERRRRWLAASVASFAVAIAAKSIVMTLPIVLVVLDAWLGRLGSTWRASTAAARRAVWMDKVPYVVIAVAGGAMALFAVWTGGFLTPVETYPFTARLAMTGYSLAFYVRALFVPVELTPHHDLPRDVSVLDPPFLLSALAVLAITVAVVVLRRRWPAGLAAWTAYALMLAPVSGLLHNGHQLVADRYSYLATLPFALLLGAGVTAMHHAAASGRLTARDAHAATAVVILWLLGFATLTWNQVQIWKDTETLWRYAVDVDPGCALCHSQLGAELGNRGLIQPAFEEFTRAVALRPDDAGVRGNLGLAFLKMNRPDEAIAQFRAALVLRPRDAGLRNRLGAALIRQGNFREASAELQQALALEPDHADALTNLAVATHALGRSDEASRHLRRAIALKPDVTTRLDPAFVGPLLGPAPDRAPAAR